MSIQPSVTHTLGGVLDDGAGSARRTSWTGSHQQWHRHARRCPRPENSDILALPKPAGLVLHAYDIPARTPPGLSLQADPFGPTGKQQGWRLADELARTRMADDSQRLAALSATLRTSRHARAGKQNEISLLLQVAPADNIDAPVRRLTDRWKNTALACGRSRMAGRAWAVWLGESGSDTSPTGSHS